MRRLVLVLMVMAAALATASGVALAVDKVGTNGPDQLRGTNRADNLSGKGGGDILHGLGGNDYLVGGPGADAVVCGGGFDRVLAEPKDTITGDCERVRMLQGSVKELIQQDQESFNAPPIQALEAALAPRPSN